MSAKVICFQNIFILLDEFSSQIVCFVAMNMLKYAMIKMLLGHRVPQIRFHTLQPRKTTFCSCSSDMYCQITVAPVYEPLTTSF